MSNDPNIIIKDPTTKLNFLDKNLMVHFVREAPITAATEGIPISKVEHIYPDKFKLHFSYKVAGEIGEVWAKANPIAIPEIEIIDADDIEPQKLLYLDSVLI